MLKITVGGWKDQLSGGLADEKTPRDFSPESLKKGLEVELEHTSDPVIALEVAMDHLVEDPNYYDKLAQANLEESVLAEITTAQVLDTMNLESKKFKKRLLFLFRTIFYELWQQAGDEFEDPNVKSSEWNKSITDEFHDFYESFVKKTQMMVPLDIEPAQQGAALNWIKNWFLKVSEESVSMGRYVFRDGRNVSSELHRLRGILEEFFQKQRFIPDEYPKDLNRYEDFAMLDYVITQADHAYQEYVREKDFLDAKQGMKQIADADGWQIFIPTNKGAACELGKGTRWCTAAPGLDYYSHYHKEDDPLIVFVNKQEPKERYQFHYGTGQFMDVKDEPVEGETFVKLHKILMRNAPNEMPKGAKEMLIDNPDGTASQKHEYNGEHGGEPEAWWNWVDAPEDVKNNAKSGPSRVWHRIDGPALIKYDHWGFSMDREDRYPRFLLWGYKGNILGEVYIESDGHLVEFTFRERGKSDKIVEKPIRSEDSKNPYHPKHKEQTGMFDDLGMPKTAQDFWTLASEMPEFVEFKNKMETQLKKMATKPSIKEGLRIFVGRK